MASRLLDFSKQRVTEQTANHRIGFHSHVVGYYCGSTLRSLGAGRLQRQRDPLLSTLDGANEVGFCGTAARQHVPYTRSTSSNQYLYWGQAF